MTTKDGREIARTYEQRVLKALHKYGWLRTRDLAVLIWMRANSRPKSAGFLPEPIVVEQSAWRMAQRTLARLRNADKVLWKQAPDGSTIYGLAEAGAHWLVRQGISASSGKDLVRRVSMSYYHHRRIANEIAILASRQGYRVASEREIAVGQWFGGTDGVAGKEPDVIVRDGKDVYWYEVERSRRNHKDAATLRTALVKLWSDVKHPMDAPVLPGGYRLKKVVFVCESAFIDALTIDLEKLGWTKEMIGHRILSIRLLYVTEGKFLLKPK